jgi:hypothetical protein
MGIIRRDQNELRYNSIWLLTRQDPDYFFALIRNAKGFFYGMDRMDLINEMEKMMEDKIENIMGVPIDLILNVHKNLTLKGFTRSKNPLYADINIYKYTITLWLNELEKFIFQNVTMLENSIRFTTPARQYI